MNARYFYSNKYSSTSTCWKLVVVIVIIFHIDNFVNSDKSWYVFLCVAENLVDLRAWWMVDVNVSVTLHVEVWWTLGQAKRSCLLYFMYKQRNVFLFIDVKCEPYFWTTFKQCFSSSLCLLHMEITVKYFLMSVIFCYWNCSRDRGPHVGQPCCRQWKEKSSVLWNLSTRQSWAVRFTLSPL